MKTLSTCHLAGLELRSLGLTLLRSARLVHEGLVGCFAAPTNTVFRSLGLPTGQITDSPKKPLRVDIEEISSRPRAEHKPIGKTKKTRRSGQRPNASSRSRVQIRGGGMDGENLFAVGLLLVSRKVMVVGKKDSFLSSPPPPSPPTRMLLRGYLFLPHSFRLVQRGRSRRMRKKS